MFRKRIVCLAAVCCLLLGASTALAAEVDADAVYCFTSEDFEENGLTYRFITYVNNKI